MKFLFLTLLLAAVSVNTAFSACSNGWSAFGNKCFRATGMSGTFSDADEYCGRLVSRSATIKSEQEQQFLEKLIFKQTGMTNQNVWLGGHRQNLKWAWRNDEILIEGNVYSNWANNKPSLVFAKACLQMNSGDSSEPGRWSDEYCFARNYIVCEQFSDGTDIDDDDDDDDDNDVSIGCCAKLETKLQKLQDKMEKKFDKIQDELDQNSDKIKRMQKNLNKVLEQIDDWTDRMNSLTLRMDRIDVDGIQSNFTGIANVLDYLNTNLNRVMEQVTSGQGNMDLDAIKVIILETIDEKLSNLNIRDTVNDIKLDYVNWRRALMAKKNGVWKQVGYV